MVIEMKSPCAEIALPVLVLLAVGVALGVLEGVAPTLSEGVGLAVGVDIGVFAPERLSVLDEDGEAPTLSEGVGEAVRVGVAEGKGAAEPAALKLVPPVHE